MTYVLMNSNEFTVANQRGWKLIVNVRIHVEVYAHFDDEVCSLGWKLIVNVRIHVEVYAHFDDEVCSIVFYTVKRKSPHKNCRKNPQSTHNRKQ